MDAQIYENDLENRFPTYTFNTSTFDDLTIFQALDGATVIATGRKPGLAEAVYDVWQKLVGDINILPISTQVQRDALTSVTTGTVILNDDTYSIECQDDDIWYKANGTIGWQVRPNQSIQTTDDTQTTIDEFTLNDDATYLVQVNITGIEDDGSDRCGVIKTAVCYRDGGSAIIEGNVALTIEEYSDSNWDADITVSGNNVRASVTGSIGETINWKCSMQFIEQ